MQVEQAGLQGTEAMQCEQETEESRELLGSLESLRGLRGKVPYERAAYLSGERGTRTAGSWR